MLIRSFKNSQRWISALGMVGMDILDIVLKKIFIIP